MRADGQTDTGQILPAKLTAHVGWGHSGMIHSYPHRKTETHTHTHTQYRVQYTVYTQNFPKKFNFCNKGSSGRNYLMERRGIWINTLFWTTSASSCFPGTTCLLSDGVVLACHVGSPPEQIAFYFFKRNCFPLSIFQLELSAVKCC